MVCGGVRFVMILDRALQGYGRRKWTKRTEEIDLRFFMLVALVFSLPLSRAIGRFTDGRIMVV